MIGASLRLRLPRPLLLGLICCSHFVLLAGPSPGQVYQPAMLFRDPSILRVSTDPGGQWIVALMRYHDTWGISAQRRGDAVTYPVFARQHPILDVTWIGENELMLLVEDRRGYARKVLLRLRMDALAVVADELDVVWDGDLVDGLPQQDGFVLWGSANQRDSFVHRVAVAALTRRRSDLAGGDGVEPAAEQLARVRGDVDHWVTDRNGAVRAYLKVHWRDGLHYEVGYRGDASGHWRKLAMGRSSDTEEVIPLGISSDGKRLVVIAYAGRNTRGLHEFDPERGEFSTVLFVDPEFDITGALFDHSGSDVIAAQYSKGGKIQYAYLGGYAGKYLTGVEARMPGETLRVVSSSADHQYFVLLAYGPTNPGTYYYFARGSNTWVRLADALLGVRSDGLVPVRSIRAISKDGTRVEGLLTIPSPGVRDPRRPLLVLPHGGPIGVSDGTRFDPLVQYMALSGIAVLQVNYRGSSGYGKEFEEAGLQQWGTGIEDDIDAVVQAAIDDGYVDPDRMCIGGGSYGGYSALISVIRWPNKYRCAVTMAGVTDIPLMFQGSDWSAFEDGRSAMKQVVGDPESDLDQLTGISPVYRAREIQVPVLIAHGTHDERVDIEHAYRLRAMLDAHHKPYEWLEIDGGHHSPTRTEWLRYASSMRAFLHQHLGKMRPHQPAP